MADLVKCCTAGVLRLVPGARARRGSLALSLLGFCAIWPGVAHAQLQGTVLDMKSRGRNVSVTERERPEYDAPGILAGGFVLSPSLTANVGATDNVYEQEANKKSDGYTMLSASVTANSTWSQHALNMEMHGSLLRYFHETVRDEDRYGASLRGRYDATAHMSVNGLASYNRRYESQYDLGSVQGGASTIPIDNYAATVSTTLNRGRFRISALANANKLDYHGYTNFGGTLVSQDYRDRYSLAGAGQVDVAVSPSTFVFFQAGYEAIRYDHQLAPGIENRDSDAVRVIAGASTDLTELIRGRIGIGYISRDYRSPAFRTVKGLSVEGQLEYFASELTTVTLRGYRRVEDSSSLTSGGYFRIGTEARVDHEFLRNLLVNVKAGYDRANYGSGTGKAELWQVGAGATYLMNRHVTFDVGVNYAKRTQDTTIIGNPFSSFSGSASLRYKF